MKRGGENWDGVEEKGSSKRVIKGEMERETKEKQKRRDRREDQERKKRGIERERGRRGVEWSGERVKKKKRVIDREMETEIKGKKKVREGQK